MRRALASAVLAVCVVLPAPAAASDHPPLRAALTACVAAQDPAGRRAEFTGSMPALVGTRRMAMRFDLFERRPGHGRRFRRVEAPGLGGWEVSAPGRAGFIFAKRVVELAAPARYRALVRFRWYDAAGRVQRRAVRRTPVCVQPDPRPNLRAVDLTAAPGPEPGTWRYRVSVRNAGHGPGGDFEALLTVDGSPASARAAATPPPRRETVLELVGPACAPGQLVRVDVDVSGTVDEADEGDNTLVRFCPDPSIARRDGR